MTLGKTSFKFTSGTTLEFTSDTTLEEFTGSTTFGDANPCTSAFFNLVNINESTSFNSSKLLFTFIVFLTFSAKMEDLKSWIFNYADNVKYNISSCILDPKD